MHERPPQRLALYQRALVGSSFPLYRRILLVTTLVAQVQFTVCNKDVRDEARRECDSRSGPYIMNMCKTKINHEGLGSTLTFWRAGLAYALLLNLSFVDVPWVVGHKVGTAANQWLGLGWGCRCSSGALNAEITAGRLQHVVMDLKVDWTRDGGTYELARAVDGYVDPQSVVAKVQQHHGPDVVFEMTSNYCPRLGKRLAGGLAERVEEQLRAGYRHAAAKRNAFARLPWAHEPKDVLQVAVHYRGGDVLSQNQVLSDLSQKALQLDTEPESFPTLGHGTRRIPLIFSVRAIKAVQAVLLSVGKQATFWFFSEGNASWFDPLRKALPELRIKISAPVPCDDDPGCDNEDGDLADHENRDEEHSRNALETLDALAAADVLILGGGAFSQLAASLNSGSIALAPESIWSDQMVVPPRHAKVISYPEAALSPDAIEALETLAVPRYVHSTDL
eukprot:TRINITY_DN75430_c0_g1_i1.p1 TRINITY_DN75430_c0_g1~~TRINITY_DN75430_c0_g1_i1.p1  ORF type:complete len:449 (-),score=57.49 TRINITY_DN75430_c0_g1_i1:95-1441(-)